jgi:hypothetical protein
MCFYIENLKEQGFQGFIKIKNIKQNYNMIPDEKGLYLIYNDCSNITFLNISTGGFFHGKNPTVRIDALNEKWVEGANTLYIGKAGGVAANGRIYKSTLRGRIKLYMQFGSGQPVGHWGGRYIWQIRESDDLLVAYKILENENPVKKEKEILSLFREHYKEKLPFANIRSA